MKATVSDVKEIIYNLDVELLAIQELDDTAAFTLMLSSMDGYEGFYGNYIACA